MKYMTVWGLVILTIATCLRKPFDIHKFVFTTFISQNKKTTGHGPWLSLV